MPSARAARGDDMLRLDPVDDELADVCSCAPAKILMKVDLPAPLSPSTQVTSPAFTDVVTSRSAITLP